ncbi:MAG TPA: PRTRC system protein D, partial [Candidatus Paceibacterota bacterium]
ELEIDGAIYVVGKDANASALSNTLRILDDEYSLSNVYLALVRGALYYMKTPKIDMLVLGLPLTTYESHREKLRERMVGGHTLPNPMRKTNKAAPEHISVQVEHVRILPQPVGAFFNYSVPAGLYTKMSAQTNLILVVGHGTFDWFLANGSTPIKARCDGYRGGVSKVISSVAEAIDGGIKDNLRILDRIDLALRTKEPVMISGKEIDVAKVYAKTAQNAIRESVSAMLQSVGDLRDVDNIILTGGGAELFYDEVSKAIPNREIIKDKNPIFSNVRGFQMVAEQWASELKG